MPDLERRITEELDRLGEHPDPDQVMDRVGARKRRARTTRRLQQAALVVLVLAGIGAGLYGLGHAFGLGSQPETVGGNPTSPIPPTHHHHSSAAPVHPTPTVNPSPSSQPASPQTALCSAQTSTVTQRGQQGAAGTIRTVWKVTNTSAAPCHSFGYPGMDFHASSGWLNEQVHRGGFPDINGAPTTVVIQPGQSLFLVSYWSDVTTAGGSCRSFDRVKVTLPDNTVSSQMAATGCVTPGSVDVGPVK
jgi:hypothetical protein